MATEWLGIDIGGGSQWGLAFVLAQAIDEGLWLLDAGAGRMDGKEESG